MQTKRGRLVDVLLIVAMLLPIVFCITLQVLFKSESAGISVNGATIYFSYPPLDPNASFEVLSAEALTSFFITEAQINSWAVLASLFFLCLFLTRRLSIKHPSARQHLAEWIVQTTENLVKGNMGDYFDGYAPFIGAIIGLSAFSSLLSLLGLFPPTTDLNVVAGWAILVFILITYYKFKCGPLYYLKGMAEPVPILAPINIISEFATPVSMAFRHYGNVLSGVVVGILVTAGLQGLSAILLGGLPGFLGEFPFFRIGIPAVLSVYFDVFSGCLQAFIFAMLTMMYISGAFPAEDYFARRAKIEAKKKAKKNLGGK